MGRFLKLEAGPRAKYLTAAEQDLARSVRAAGAGAREWGFLAQARTSLARSLIERGQDAAAMCRAALAAFSRLPRATQQRLRSNIAFCQKYARGN